MLFSDQISLLHEVEYDSEGQVQITTLAEMIHLSGDGFLGTHLSKMSSSKDDYLVCIAHCKPGALCQTLCLLQDFRSL